MVMANQARKRALVLGGGGPVGVAWEIGLLAGLLDAGIDARNADLIIGTSAGSIVGTQLAYGRDPRMQMEGFADAPPGAVPAAVSAPPRDATAAADAFGLWASFDEMTPANCANVGRIALAARTMAEEDWVNNFIHDEPEPWPPTPLLAVAVDCESGAMRAFDAAQGVELRRAIAASCAVPAILPPVTIEGRRYMDGGVRSGTSADLALRIKPDAVLIIAPLGSQQRGIGALCRRQIENERTQLEAIGARVIVVHMDDAALAAAPNGLMDASARVPAAAAARKHGARIADEVRELWISVLASDT
jgi:NTE family protein